MNELRNKRHVKRKNFDEKNSFEKRSANFANFRLPLLIFINFVFQIH